MSASVSTVGSVQLLVAATRDLTGDWAALTAAERRRAAAFHNPGDAADFLAAHLAGRQVLARLTGEALPVAQHCSECGSDEHGRPAVPGRPELGLSWSHSRGVVAAAAAFGPVGVDVETRARPHDVSRLLRRTATPEEAETVRSAGDPGLAYLRMWTAKEALVKVGVLTLAGFRSVDVRAGSYAGFTLTLSETPSQVVAVALREPQPPAAG